MIEKLTDIEAGQLLKHLFRYVNDQNPVPENRIIELSFESIKHQLKRDLKEWESTKQILSAAGREGGLKSAAMRRLKKSKPPQATLETVEPPQAFQPVNVTVNVNDTVNVIKEHTYIEKIKSEFPKLLKMKEPLTSIQAERLEKEYGNELVFKTMEGMQNKPNLHKDYESANLTIRSWIRLKLERNGQVKTLNTPHEPSAKRTKI